MRRQPTSAAEEDRTKDGSIADKPTHAGRVLPRQAAEEERRIGWLLILAPTIVMRRAWGVLQQLGAEE